MTIVTAEMIDEAMEAANSIIHLTNTGGVFARDYCNVGMMRAALEAVAPALITREHERMNLNPDEAMNQASMTAHDYAVKAVQCARDHGFEPTDVFVAAFMVTCAMDFATAMYVKYQDRRTDLDHEKIYPDTGRSPSRGGD